MREERIAALAGASALEWILEDPQLLQDFLEQIDEEVASAVEKYGAEMVKSLKRLARGR